jgi:recombination protein RecR
MHFTPCLESLLSALRHLPGVGPKSAQRIAFHLLEKNRDGAQQLVVALQAALDQVGQCQQCRMFAEDATCPICQDAKRDATLVCIVESPADVIAIEEAAGYRGFYFVLMGRLSPLDGVGPDALGASQLESRLAEGEIKEMIIATSATVEGEATATYLASLANRHGVSATRIAHGVPMGGELEFVDSNTLSRAIAARTSLSAE